MWAMMRDLSPCVAQIGNRRSPLCLFLLILNLGVAFTSLLRIHLELAFLSPVMVKLLLLPSYEILS